MLDRSLNPENKAFPLFATPGGPPVGWAVSTGYVPYPAAVAAMEARAAAIADGTAGELVWLLEHPPLYTAGVSSKPADLIAPDRFPVFESGRGGQFTYHGPGQRVAYVMLDLTRPSRISPVTLKAARASMIQVSSAATKARTSRPRRVRSSIT